MSAYAFIVEPFETLAFMRTALVACLALALANGAVGTLMILRRAQASTVMCSDTRSCPAPQSGFYTPGHRRPGYR
jgi:hypothetical protein